MKKSLAGGRLYWFSHPGNQNLIITAHGGKPKPGDNIAWPPPGAGSPTLYFCSMHGKSTTTQVEEILQLIAGSSQALLDALKANGFHPVFLKSVPNYHLEKYAGYHGYDTEDYADYESWVQNGQCDIVSPATAGSPTRQDSRRSSSRRRSSSVSTRGCTAASADRRRSR